jgi:hypothetical protein
MMCNDCRCAYVGMFVADRALLRLMVWSSGILGKNVGRKKVEEGTLCRTSDMKIHRDVINLRL